MIAGCSVLVWLSIIIPELIAGTPIEFVEIYTTEPTFVIDLGILLPSCVMTGLAISKRKKSAYVLASILFTLVTCVGVCVITQTVVQKSLGMELAIGQIIGMVVSFVILGAIATIINYGYLMCTRENE